MRRIHASQLAVAWLLLVFAALAHADAGLVRLSELSGPLRVSVFTSPTPLRVGPMEVSVMVQEAESEQLLLDAEVSVLLAPEVAGAPTLRLEARERDATNKLLRVARAELPAAGVWKLFVSVKHGTVIADVDCALEILPALPRWFAYWPYLVVPPIAVVVFAMHQWRSRSLGRQARAG